MKYFTTAILIVFVSLFSFGQTSVPCENPIQGAACNLGGAQPEDGSGTLGMTYNNTACGLNYIQTSLMTTTRYTPAPGTGMPAPINITIPCGANVDQAYVWWGASNNSPDPNFTFNGVPLVGTLIGTGPHKCWSLGGTENYRGDVTALITATGTYNFTSPIGTGVDGVTLMVIYTDPSATYQGTLQINDGAIVNNSGSSSDESMTITSVCANSTYGEAFLIVGDMQDNVAPPSHTATLNGVAQSFPNLFWNFDILNTNYTVGQTVSQFGVVPDGTGDCYDWVMKGVYYQTTSCVTCVPAPSGALTSNSTSIDATCGNCDGTATANPVGGIGPYTYSWNTVPVQTTQTATNLCAGTYIVSFSDAGCLTGADTITVVTTAGPVAPIVTSAGPFCTSDPVLNLITTGIGGTWSGTGITSPVNGTFDPATAGVGSHQIIYVDGGICPGSDTITIIVNSIADATITPVGPYCPNDPIVILTAVSPGGAWSGTGITNTATGEFTPSVAGPGTYTITYGVPGSCGDTQTVNITINPFLDATITPAGPFCLVDPAINLTPVDIGGAWTGTGITNGALGTFDPAVAGAGTHTITYGIPGTCGDTQTVNIIVSAALNATITPAGPFCESDPSAILTAVDPGGVWSGNGITNTLTGLFDPAIAGAGTHTITYGISSSCGDTQTVNIIIIPDADATITPVGTLCIADPAFNLTAVDLNGTWTGTGITNGALGTFDPANAGVGTHAITYTIAGACGDAQTINITVLGQDDATITPAGPFCVDANSVSLIAATSGGIWSGNGITNPTVGIFNPATAGPGTHTITYTTPGACGNTDTQDIIINPLPNVDFIADTFGLCEMPQQAFTFTNTTTPIGGMVVWNFGDGNGATGDIVSHPYAGSGSYDITLTVTDANGCSNTLTKVNYVNVFANPIADFTISPNPASMFDPTVQFIDQSQTNIVSWSWDIGGVDSSNIQNPTYIFPEDTGHYLVILTVVDANGCIDTTSNTAIVLGEFGIYVPNSFTPDGDGMNDAFFPNGFGITEKDYSFMIFDRWGERLFESHQKFAPWKGTYKGTVVPNGVYVWKLIFKDINGKEHTEHGHVTIVK